ncbi:MAG: hypothetical protein HQK50_15860 [Oligoflexia bacterium]|nr:hypothetical protein [Oligoflexia bacterium]MBF0367050.1 hypothetical protein [Oligoflexia bacterium]
MALCWKSKYLFFFILPTYLLFHCDFTFSLDREECLKYLGEAFIRHVNPSTADSPTYENEYIHHVSASILVKDKRLSAILHSGAILNQHQTATGVTPSYSMNDRLNLETDWLNNTLNTSMKKIPKDFLPKYGLLEYDIKPGKGESNAPPVDEDTTTLYGAIQLFLKKTVFPRISYTLGDSLDQREKMHALHDLSELTKLQMGDPDDPSSMANQNLGYIEIQAWGPITLSDIDRVEIFVDSMAEKDIRKAIDPSTLDYLLKQTDLPVVFKTRKGETKTQKGTGKAKSDKPEVLTTSKEELTAFFDDLLKKNLFDPTIRSMIERCKNDGVLDVVTLASEVNHLVRSFGSNLTPCQSP